MPWRERLPVALLAAAFGGSATYLFLRVYGVIKFGVAAPVLIVRSSTIPYVQALWIAAIGAFFGLAYGWLEVDSSAKGAAWLGRMSTLVGPLVVIALVVSFLCP